MIDLAPHNIRTESLRYFLDTIEKHLRCLEVLKDNKHQNMFVSMIKSKIPRDVLLHIEIQKGTDHEWSVQELNYRLLAYITAKERADQDKYSSANTKKQMNNFGLTEGNYNGTQQQCGNYEKISMAERPHT